MSLPLNDPDMVLGAVLTESPQPDAAFSRSPSEFSIGSSDEEATLAGDEIPPSRRPIRFRSASLAIDAAMSSFNTYRNPTRKNRKAKDDRMISINTEMSYIATMASPLTVGLEGSTMNICQYGRQSMVEGLPELLKVLQDVAAIHPFIQLAVGAFKVAIELDLKRRENDKKIDLLFLEMRDMMSALIELQNVEDGPTHMGKDGKTVQARLEGLVGLMEVDIRDCANACDAYAKKKMISKVIQGLRWDDALQVYVQRFNKRRADIEFALAIHLGVNIDIAHRKLDSLDEKIDQVISLLHQSSSPEQRELSSLIERRGGPSAVLADEQLLASLSRGRHSNASTPTHRTFRSRQRTSEFNALKAEVVDDPDIAIANNSETFERKFRMQKRELTEEIGRIVRHRGDLVISAVTAGPHDRIVDTDLRNIWKEMNWRGNVKARHFVLALRDYCMDKIDKLRKGDTTFSECQYRPMVTEQDEWTLEYINVTRLQALIEAFDDDASGFITVAEANTFTTSRPADWSLLHWMAYWAVGWQMAMSEYIVQIDELLEKMFAIKSLVLPANRRFVERYLDSTWSLITELTTGFRRAEWSSSMRDKFLSYVSQQEEQMKERLEDVRYDIDAADTLLLVTGPGRIEKHLFILLYLLLKRDFEVFRLARTTVLHKDELWDSANTLEWVFRAVSLRHADLENLFKQQNHDPSQQFKIFSFELFNYWHDPNSLWSFDRLRESRYVNSVYRDQEEDSCVSPADILNHPVENVDDPLTIPEYIESWEDQIARGPLHAILGHWCGFLGQAMLYPCEPMMSIDLHAATSHLKPNEFVASGSIPSGTRWKLSGEVKRADDRSVYYSFTITYAARLWPRRFHAVLSDDGCVLSGSWHSTSHSEGGAFSLKRLSCEVMRFWPLPADLHARRAGALWTFATRAVLDQVRRRLFSKSHLEGRQQTRQRYLQIIRSGDSNPVYEDDEELEATKQCYLNMTPAEARYYHMVYEYRQRLAPKHYGVSCAHCRATVSGVRYICLDCHTPRLTVDLCEKKDCTTAVVGPDRRSDLVSPHLPTHRLLKVRKVVHRHREFGEMYRTAHDALARAQEALSDATAVQSWEAPEDGQRNGNGVTHEHSRALMNEGLRCAGCQTQVSMSRSSWYCVECEDDTFFCISCEADDSPIRGKHKATHGLVLCQPPREEAHFNVSQPAEGLHQRMVLLESSLDKIQRECTRRFDALDRSLGDIHSRATTNYTGAGSRDLEDRMRKIEDLLGALLNRLGDANGQA